MAENLGDHFDRDTGAEGNGGSKGVTANVCGDGFLNTTCRGKGFKIAIVHVVGKVWQLAVPSLSSGCCE